MLSDEALNSWLRATNRRYGVEGVPHKKRPFTALSDFTREHNCSFSSDHPTSKAIFQWFYEHSPPGAHHVGSVYTGIYFYDAAFWAVHIRLIFGTVSVDALDCLETMPKQIKETMAASHRDVWNYATHWVNCMDHGYGYMDLAGSERLTPRAASFLSAAHAEIRGANAQLLEPRPIHKAILSLRMANEIFLKSVLVQELDLSEDKLRSISHKLDDAASRCGDVTGERTFGEIAKRVRVYPPVSARYDQPSWSAAEVWEAATLAQLTAAAVTRLYSDRDSRSAVLPAE